MNALSRRQRILATLVLTAGAFASVATTRVYWEVADSEPLPGFILDVAQPSVGFAVRADLVGTVSLPSGHVTLELVASFPLDRPNPARLTVSIGRVGDPDNLETRDVTVDPSNPNIYLDATGFEACEAAPCSEEFTIWIDRADLDGPPITPIMIDGEIRIQVTQDNDGNEPPAGTAVTLTVTQLEDQI